MRHAVSYATIMLNDLGYALCKYCVIEKREHEHLVPVDAGFRSPSELRKGARRALSKRHKPVHQGAASRLGAAEIIASPIVYYSVVDRAFVQSLLAAEKAGADVFVAASFSEPILPELRSLAQIPVVSMSEACFVAAAATAPKVGFVTLNKHIIPFIEKSIFLHKWQDRVSGVHLIEGDTSETELDAKFSEPGPYLERLTTAARSAIAAGAQVVIVAEGILGMMAAANELREVDGVPLIDAIGTPILFAQFIVWLKRRTGIRQSRTAYPLPSEAARDFVAAG